MADPDKDDKPDKDETRLGDPDETRMAPASPVSRSSGRPRSSPRATDHGRFEPGAVIDDRYRVIGLIGRGGMGEVYRADDLRLDQPVALKFLPDALAQDPDRLAQFHNEVRTARQVSHPNVCRMHDIGEVDGHTYLTMEYVDGEDLATSLRRIGRFPEDKATDIARQLAAGLAAAHDRGIIHRDLKPANVMLDGNGRVRIMDFGLASLGDDEHVRAGTPAYMAPEQLRGQPASAKSDLFALGLVLYELFTGRRAFTANTVDGLLEQHATKQIAAPSTLITSLDPVVERAILRCLDPEPARRPASAIAVAASLPGGDPLAMALAAGETPSPELVAAAGAKTSVMSTGAAAACLVVTLVSLAAAFTLADRFSLLGQVPFTIEPRALADRARQFEERIGAGANAIDRASGFGQAGDVVTWLTSRPADEQRRLLQSNRPSPLMTWYRSSPRLLVPTDDTQFSPGPTNPPLTVTGMTVTAVDLKGRLVEFAAVPPQVESLSTARPPVDWKVFFDAAGLDMSAFQPVTPDWTPRSYADARFAWQGASPDAPDVQLRIEAASHRGVPVNFQMVGPWARPVRMQAPQVDRATAITAFVATVIVVPVMMGGGILLARRNLKLGRGDRRGAITLATVTFGLAMLQWALGAAHFADVGTEQSRFGSAIAFGLQYAVLVGLMYLAIEPEVRRLWPQLLFTWSRLLTGQFRDSLLGRDLVIGAAAGSLMTLVTFAHYLLPSLFGWAPFRPAFFRWDALGGTSSVVAVILAQLTDSLQNAILGCVGVVVFRRIAPWKGVPFALATLLFAFLAARSQIQTGRMWLDLALGAILVAIVLGVTVRWGLVAGAATFFVHFLTKEMPITANPDRLYFGVAMTTGLVVMAVAVGGLALARRNVRSNPGV